MFVCPIGLALVAFCANLLSNIDQHQLQCDKSKEKFEDGIIIAPLSSLTHVACCPVELKHIHENCDDFLGEYLKIGEYLQSEERSLSYDNLDKHNWNIARELIIKTRDAPHYNIKTNFCPFPNSRLITSPHFEKKKLFSAFEHLFEPNRLMFLSDGSVGCLYIDFSNLEHCISPSQPVTSCFQVYVYPCNGLYTGWALDLRNYIKRIDKHPEFVVSIPGFSFAMLSNKQIALPPWRSQLKFGVDYDPFITTTTTTTTITTTTTTTTTTRPITTTLKNPHKLDFDMDPVSFVKYKENETIKKTTPRPRSQKLKPVFEIGDVECCDFGGKKGSILTDETFENQKEILSKLLSKV